MFKNKKYALIALCAASCLSLPARADYVENFDELPLNAPYNSSNLPTASGDPLLPLTTASGGLSVTYTDTAATPTTSPPPNSDPYGFLVRSNLEPNSVSDPTPRFNFVSLTGNLFIDFGIDPMKISLSAPENAIQFNFGLRFPSDSDDGPGDTAAIAPPTSLILDAYLNGVLVGTGLYATAIPTDHEFEEGFASFGGVTFDEIDIVSTDYDYALYNGHGPASAPVSIAIDNVEIPEPGSWALLAAGLPGLAVLRRKSAR
jgi:hypothetical protein